MQSFIVFLVIFCLPIFCGSQCLTGLLIWGVQSAGENLLDKHLLHQFNLMHKSNLLFVELLSFVQASLSY